MKYYIGIDGGGTKTEAVLCDEQGRMLSRTVTGPSNFSAFPEDKVRLNISGCVTGCTEAAGITPSDITAIYAGLAGGLTYTAKIAEVIKGIFDGTDAIVRIGGDAVNIISCGLLTGDGIGIISGTGSCCFARKGDKLIQFGGWGYFVDKRGSSFDIGRDIIGAILCAMDGRGPDTMLKELYIERTGVTPDRDMQQIYGKGVQYIASFAPLAFIAEEKGDEVAARIIDDNMAGIALCVNTALHKFTDDEYPVKVALGGGTFRNRAAYSSLLRQLDAGAQAEVLPTEPVFGAVVEAMRADGLKPDEAVRDSFIATYHK